MKVSICMITYNHEKFIAQAIEGVLMQNTSFQYELVIGEDCSTDSTRKIIEEYQIRYPDKIRLLLRPANLGIMPNIISTLKSCKGEYIAMCEGDDYWTDPLKLQKQVNFLDNNSNFIACCSNVQRLNDNNKQLEFDLKLNQDIEEEYDFINLLKRDAYIYTATFLFRNNVVFFPKWLVEVQSGDKSLFYLTSLKGKIKYFPDITAVYRFNPASISHIYNKDKIRQWENYLFVLNNVNKEGEFEFDYYITEHKKPFQLVVNILKEKNLAKKGLLGFKYFINHLDKSFLGVKSLYWLLKA